MKTPNSNQSSKRAIASPKNNSKPDASSKPPGSFSGRAQLSPGLRTWLRQGQPDFPKRNEPFVRALLRAMSDRVANPDQPHGFGGPLRFNVWFGAERLPVIATVHPDDDTVMQLEIAPDFSN